MDLAQGEQPQEEERKIDLRFYWAVFKRRFWLILGVAAAVTAVAVVYTARKPKIYRATATVIVDPQAPNVLGQELQVVQLGTGSVWFNAEYYNTQARILTSRSFARQVVERFQLHHDKRLVPGLSTSADEDTLIEAATDALQGRIAITLPNEHRIVAISIADTDPELARDLANFVRTVYIDQNVSNKQDTTRDARRLVAKLLDSARSDLFKSETELFAFRKDNNMLSVSFEDRQDLISKRLDAFSGALTDVQRKRIELGARRKALGSLLTDDPLSMPTSYVVNSASVEGLRQGYFEERNKLRSLEERYGPRHPQVIVQEAATAGALADLKTEVAAIVRAMDTEVAALDESETRFAAEVNNLTQEALELNMKEVDYRRLSRDTKNSESIYGQLLTRFNESGLQEKDPANNIKPLDEARKPTAPIAPNVRMAAVGGLGIGILLALGLAFLVEFLDRSVKSQADIESIVRLPFLGLVPSIEGTPLERYQHITKNPGSTVAESCRTVRTNILFSSPDRPLRRLLVSSSNPVEGKTMTVVNLGVVMAQSGHRTLIVDADMRRPTLHKALGVANDAGLSNLVFAEAEIDQLVKSTDVPDLFILPCGPLPPNPAELLQTERFTALAEKLSTKFDRVIFDSPPILAVTDAAVLSRAVDGVVLVVRAGKTTRDAVSRAKGLLGKVAAHVVGVVLNDVDLRSPHYSSYYYYRSYRYDSPAVAAAGKGSSSRGQS